MSNKPSYIGLLNAIATGERGGHELFASWSAATKDKKLKKTLDMVAIREMEHSWAFEKRLCELGFGVRDNASPEAKKDLAKRVKLLGSKASDAEKFAAFGIGKGKKKNKGKGKKKKGGAAAQTDGLLQVLADPSIDPQTGALLGRFICEERDTGRELQAAFRDLKRRS